jgi:hypothetical protein
MVYCSQLGDSVDFLGINKGMFRLGAELQYPSCGRGFELR